MKKQTFMIPLVLLMAGVMATAFSPAQDNKADKILRDSKAKFEGLQDYAASFEYAIENQAIKNSPTIEKSGKIKIKNDMFTLSLGDQEIYCDGETQWIYLKQDNEVNILPYDREDGLNIESVFQLYESNARSRYEGTEMVNNANCHKIFLAISDASLDYNQGTLWISQRSGLPIKAELKDRNQTLTEIVFSDVKTNQNYPDSDFVFNVSAHPDVAVYDER